MEETSSNEDGNGNRDRELSNLQSTRTVDRPSRQRIHIPTLEKRDYTSAKLWWRRFTQYIKMTRDLDLKELTTDKEIKTEYRDLLNTEIYDIFAWAYHRNVQKY